MKKQLLFMAMPALISSANADSCQVAPSSCAKIEVINERNGWYKIENLCSFPIIYTSKNHDGQRMYTNPIKPGTAENVGATRKDIVIFDSTNGYLSENCLRSH